MEANCKYCGFFGEVNYKGVCDSEECRDADLRREDAIDRRYEYLMEQI